MSYSIGSSVGAGADLLLHLHPDRLKVQAQLLQDVHRNALAKFDQAQKQMLRPDKVVVKTVRLLARQGEHLLGARSEVVHGVVAHT